MLEELVAQPHCLHVHVDIWQLNMFKPYQPNVGVLKHKCPRDFYLTSSRAMTYMYEGNYV